MGSLILCHKQRARHPYEIVQTHMRIYTLEELCYYLCNNLYLIDDTIMNLQLCDWLDTELGMTGLAKDLKGKLSLNCSESQFVLAILTSSNIYGASDIGKVESTLEQLQNLRDVEKEKYKADCLMESQAYANASLVYQDILEDDWDESVDKTFYGRVYACLGSAFGRLFLYEDAAEAYREAYQICEEESMLKAYVYCKRKTMSREEFKQLLSENSLYAGMDAQLRKDIRNARRSEDMDLPPEELETWKNEYRSSM